MLTSAILAMLIAAPPELSDAAKKELQSLEGNWVIIATANAGKVKDLPADERIPVTITARKFSFGKYGDGEITALDTTTKPKLVDFKMLRKPESGLTNEAIYRFEKDTLTVVVYLGEDKNRPASFEVPEDLLTVRLTLKRMK